MTFTSNLIAPSPEAEVPMPPCGLLSDEAQRTDRLAAKLRELNIDPDTL